MKLKTILGMIKSQPIIIAGLGLAFLGVHWLLWSLPSWLLSIAYAHLIVGGLWPVIKALK